MIKRLLLMDLSLNLHSLFVAGALAKGLLCIRPFYGPHASDDHPAWLVHRSDSHLRPIKRCTPSAGRHRWRRPLNLGERRWKRVRDLPAVGSRCLHLLPVAHCAVSREGSRNSAAIRRQQPNGIRNRLWFAAGNGTRTGGSVGRWRCDTASGALSAVASWEGRSDVTALFAYDRNAIYDVFCRQPNSSRLCWHHAATWRIRLDVITQCCSNWAGRCGHIAYLPRTSCKVLMSRSCKVSRPKCINLSAYSLDDAV